MSIFGKSRGSNCKFGLFIYLLLVTLAGKAQTDSIQIKFAAAVDSLIQEGLAAGAYPGAQVYIARADDVLLHKSYGYHTYAEQRKVNAEDLYDLASITKVTTGLPVLMQLYGAGKFDLDAPLKNYLPKFKNSNKGKLIIRDILAHQAGLQPYIVYWAKTLHKNQRQSNGKLRFKNRTFTHKANKRYPIKITDELFLHKNYKKRIYKYIKKSPLETNTGYKYSGLFFLLLPDIIKNITGESLEAYLYKNIYEPVGIEHLLYNPLNKFPLNKIVPTERDTFFRKQLVHGRVHDEAAAMLGGVSCNAGLFGNAEDLGKLFQLYANGGKYKGKQIIPSKAIEEFTRCQFCASDNRRGLGFDKPLIDYVPGKSHVAKDASPESFGHSGFTGTFAWADPVNKLVVIFLCNRVYPTRENRLVYKMDIRPRLQQKVYDYFSDSQ